MLMTMALCAVGPAFLKVRVIVTATFWTSVGIAGERLHRFRWQRQRRRWLCEFVSCGGCTDPVACNYDPTMRMTVPVIIVSVAQN